MATEPILPDDTSNSTTPKRVRLRTTDAVPAAIDPDGERACDHFRYPGEFSLRLEAADRANLNGRERQFIDQLIERYDRWGDETFLSAAQARWLCALSDRGNYRHDHRILGGWEGPSWG
jgi:hypothetical protein